MISLINTLGGQGVRHHNDVIESLSHTRSIQTPMTLVSPWTKLRGWSLAVSPLQCDSESQSQSDSQ